MAHPTRGDKKAIPRQPPWKTKGPSVRMAHIPWWKGQEGTLCHSLDLRRTGISRAILYSCRQQCSSRQLHTLLVQIQKQLNCILERNLQILANSKIQMILQHVRTAPPFFGFLISQILIFRLDSARLWRPGLAPPFWGAGVIVTRLSIFVKVFFQISSKK